MVNCPRAGAMALLRHGGMSRLFSRIYAPSTLGSFLRTFRDALPS